MMQQQVFISYVIYVFASHNQTRDTKIKEQLRALRVHGKQSMNKNQSMNEEDGCEQSCTKEI